MCVCLHMSENMHRNLHVWMGVCAYTCVGQRTTSGITSQSLVTTVLSFKTRPHVLGCTQEARVDDLQTPGIPTPPPALEIKS